ncbi:hypothetical protein KI387_027527 [Taxus chinensis]|uniref:Glycosyltransferase n=1 Tax=Taxus chinensis TaxID=29808 RepID=A0AA38FXU8_TAXCH|nr:hypothetical protein KI387_027527 [Taxus chinensis]
MFPFMAQGHFIPFLRLAKPLASQGLTVSFITTTMSASKLQSHAVGSDIRFVRLSLPYIRGQLPALESTDCLSPTEGQQLFISSHKLSVPFERWLEKIIAETAQKPACIISDVFVPWTTDSASKFRIPRVVFHTTGVMAASLLQYLFTNPVPEIIGGRPIIEIRDHSINVNLRRSELPQMLRSELSFSPLPVLPVVQQVYASAKESCAATLVNSFDGVEAEYVRYLEESTCKPVWLVAPPLDNAHEWVQIESDCIAWLDSKKKKSVLYVSFGSQIFLSEDLIKAVAAGIEASKQAFIWTIKDPIGSNVNSCDFLPEGFVEATRDRGLVIHGWVPQLQILSHSSTACFMSHCGWNSTVESISAGVPMVVWPMVFDQFINAKLVIEQLGIGLQICEGCDVIPSSDIVENMVKAAMVEGTGKEMDRRALKRKKSIEETSCKVNVESFVGYILSLRPDQFN